MASKNIVSERNRRKKLNERLFALRAVVPKISKVLAIQYYFLNYCLLVCLPIIIYQILIYDSLFYFIFQEEEEKSVHDNLGFFFNLVDLLGLGYRWIRLL